MNENVTLFGIFCALVVAVFALGALVAVETSSEYQNGFCTARGGTVISADYCDVEGKVVKIER